MDLGWSIIMRGLAFSRVPPITHLWWPGGLAGARLGGAFTPSGVEVAISEPRVPFIEGLVDGGAGPLSGY